MSLPWHIGDPAVPTVEELFAALAELQHEVRAGRAALVALLHRKGVCSDAEWAAELARQRALVPLLATQAGSGLAQP